MTENGAARNVRRMRETARRPYSFMLDGELVDRARQEVGETDVIRSIEAALAAAIDYKLWVRDITNGRRDVLS